VRSYCSQWPEYHPEFGLFCPSARQRRVLRRIMLCLATVMVIGATRGLAVADRPEPDAAIVASQPTEDQLPSVTFASADAIEASRVPRVHQPCKAMQSEDLMALFLNPGCKLHGRHGGRANNRVATVIIGHVGPAPAPHASASPSLAVAALEPASSKIGEAESSPTATERAKTAKKPKPKLAAPIALSPSARELARQDGIQYGAAISAYAADPRLGRPAVAPFGDRSGRTTPRPTPWW